jgi:FkbM family methyltransferase
VLNWYTVGLLAAIVMPTRIPPRRGLKGTWLGQHVATFRMSDGSKIRCRLQDAGDLISVYVDRDYGRMQIAWSDQRSIVDVGSTVGSFTMWVARQSPSARVIAVEPNPEVYPFLVDNIRRNNLAERVTTVEAAVGSARGLASIEDDRAFSTLVRVVPIGAGRGPSVRMLTLEQLFDETETTYCDLLKIDCEGGEYDILLSASDRMLHRVRAIICEYHPTTQHGPVELMKRLSQAGFEVEADHTPIGFIRATRSR